MDLATLLGIVVCFGLVIFGILFGNDVSALLNFVDVPSLLITMGGAFCAVLASKTMPEFVNGLKSIALAFKVPTFDLPGVIHKVIELSNIARKEGLLALEEASAEVNDAFLRKGVLLIVDGTDPEFVRSILETELTCINERHKSVISFWENLASMGPAWGMIGTLIGLINMLGNLSDMAAVGPNMAIALVTTLYGSMLANWICTPVATKLKSNDAMEIMMKEIVVEGLLSIQAGENPRIIEEKLKSFISPERRKNIGEKEEGGE